jgi:hypothetical protein
VRHNKIVVVGADESGIIRYVGSAWLHGMVAAFILVQGCRQQGFLPASYPAWWDWYFVEHSKGLWFLVTLPITFGLWFKSVSIFLDQKETPDFVMLRDDDDRPTVVKMKMGIPLIWFSAYWAWILLSPWLPFYRCFVRIYLLGGDPSQVFLDS